MLNADFIKSEMSGDKKVSPFALKVEQLFILHSDVFTSPAQAIQFALDAMLDEARRIAIETAAQIIANPDSNPFSNKP